MKKIVDSRQVKAPTINGNSEEINTLRREYGRPEFYVTYSTI